MTMKYSPGQQRVEAIYSKVQNPLHQGNPLIEATVYKGLQAV